MNTLVIYDETGYILTIATGDVLRTPIGVPYILTEVLENKEVIGVDITVTPHQLILEDKQLSETELLQKQIDDLNIAMANLMGV